MLIYNAFQLNPWNPTTLAVSISLMAVVMFASVFGTFVPLTLERFKIDPALAAGPFISITNDIIGMLIDTLDMFLDDECAVRRKAMIAALSGFKKA